MRLNYTSILCHFANYAHHKTLYMQLLSLGQTLSRALNSHALTHAHTHIVSFHYAWCLHCSRRIADSYEVRLRTPCTAIMNASKACGRGVLERNIACSDCIIQYVAFRKLIRESATRYLFSMPLALLYQPHAFCTRFSHFRSKRLRSLCSHQSYT